MEGEWEIRRMTTGEKGEMKMLVLSDLRQQMGNNWGGVDQRAEGVAHGSQACYCYSTFDTETQCAMETDTPSHALQHN